MNRLDHNVVLVTGASGFIGTHLVQRLAALAGVKLLLLSREIRQPARENARWIGAELSQLTPGYWRKMDVGQIDYIFHLGGFTPKTASERNHLDRAVNDNVLGTRMLLQSLPGKPKRIVFASTLDVYQELEKDEILTEGSRAGPTGLYGASKLFCESLVAAWAHERGCESAVLRYGHIYGPGEARYGKLIPVVIRQLLKGETPVVHGDGSALRDYLYVGDAVEATLRAAGVEGRHEVVNIVRGESVTLREVVEMLIRLTGSTATIQFLHERPNGASLRFDNSRMQRLLGTWPMTGLAEGLAAEVEEGRRMADGR